MPLRRHYICSSLALVFATWLGACSDDGDDSEGFDGSDSACVPDTFRGTCLEEFFLEYGSCSNPAGACTWSEPDSGLRVEWANGARFEVTGAPSALEATRSYSSDGHTCIVSTPLATAACTGAREEINGTWIEICVEPGSATKDRRSIYRCKNGREYHVSEVEAHVDAGACPAATDLSKCVDANGVLLSNRM